MKNYVKIGSFRFDLVKCSLMAHIAPDKFYWTLRVYAKGRIGHEEVEPYAYSENLLGLFNRRLNSWKDVLDTPLSWDAGYNLKYERPEAGLYVYSHEDIEQSTLILKPSGGDNFELRWTGLTDVSGEEFDDIDDLQLEVIADGSFDGVQVFGSSEQDALSKLKWWLAGDEFSFSGLMPNESLLFKAST